MAQLFTHWTVDWIYLLYLNLQSLQSLFFLRMDQLKCITPLEHKRSNTDIQGEQEGIHRFE